MAKRMMNMMMEELQRTMPENLQWKRTLLNLTIIRSP